MSWRRRSCSSWPATCFLMTFKATRAGSDGPALVVDVCPTRWAGKSAIGLLEEVHPVDRAVTRHVVVAGHGVDRETGGEVEGSEDVGVTVAQGARVDPLGEVRPDNAGLVDVQDVMEGAWRGRVKQRIGEADGAPPVLLEVGHEGRASRRRGARGRRR